MIMIQIRPFFVFFSSEFVQIGKLPESLFKNVFFVLLFFRNGVCLGTFDHENLILSSKNVHSQNQFILNKDQLHVYFYQLPRSGLEMMGTTFLP